MSGMVDPSVSTNEKEFLLEVLKEKVRIDGRSFTDGRNMEISLGPKYGQSQVRLGRTRVASSVEAQIVRPQNTNSSEGILRLQINISPMATPTDVNPDVEVVLSRFLERGLRQSGAVDLEGLCIVAGEKVWEIKVVLTVLDYDGNIADAACTAAVCSLMHYKRCDVTVKGTEVVIHDESEKAMIPLVLHHVPICSTFAMIEDIPLLDPTSLETLVSTASVSCIITQFGEICALSKPGGTPLPMDKLLHCINMSFERAKIITEQISKALK